MSDVTDTNAISYPTYLEWVAWVDSVGGQWATAQDVAGIGRIDTRCPTTLALPAPLEAQ